MKKRRTRVDHEALTSVFWDIDKCPVPSGFDAHQVYPCIKRFLRNAGYSGPLSITAVGKLTTVPHDILRALSATGIHLTHTVSRHRNVFALMFAWGAHVDLPANVMLISTEPMDYLSVDILSDGFGLNIIYDFPHSNFIVPGPLEEEDKCSYTVGWKCTVCYLTGLGAESLIGHLSSPEHAQNVLKHPSQVLSLSSYFCVTQALNAASFPFSLVVFFCLNLTPCYLFPPDARAFGFQAALELLTLRWV